MEHYATIFKTLSDPTRLRILRLLLDAGTELCVCELVDSLEEPQYNVSKHINALKTARLVESRKDGRWVYYRPVQSGEFVRLLHGAVSAIPEKQIQQDRAELKKRLRLRQDGKCLLGIQKSGLLPKLERSGA